MAILSSTCQEINQRNQPNPRTRSLPRRPLVLAIAIHLHLPALTLAAIKSRLTMPAVKLLLLRLLTLAPEPLPRILAQEPHPILAQEPRPILILILAPEPELQHTKKLSTMTFPKLNSPRLMALLKSALLKLTLLTLSRKTQRYNSTLAKRYSLTLLARYTRRLVGAKATTAKCSASDALRLQ